MANELNWLLNLDQQEEQAYNGFNLNDVLRQYAERAEVSATEPPVDEVGSEIVEQPPSFDSIPPSPPLYPPPPPPPQPSSLPKDSAPLHRSHGDPLPQITQEELYPPVCGVSMPPSRVSQDYVPEPPTGLQHSTTIDLDGRSFILSDSLLSQLSDVAENASVAVSAASRRAVLAANSGVRVLNVLGEVLMSFSDYQKFRKLCSESLHFTVDRTRSLTHRYATNLFTDDPEVVHRRYIESLAAPALQTAENPSNYYIDFDALRLRCHLSSISWYDRQLIHEDITEPSQELKKAWAEFQGLNTDLAATSYDNEYVLASDPMRSSLCPLLTTQHGVIRPRRNDEFLDFLLLVALVHNDNEAKSLLLQYVTPPPFDEDDRCHTCHEAFNVTLFRHHCRHCGHSYCGSHAAYYIPIPKYGYIDAVRVCLHCYGIILEEARWDRIKWLLMRVCDYLKGRLIPYFEAGVDRGVDKAVRVVEGTLFVVKKTVVLNYPAIVMIETMDLLRRYGMSGLAGVLLRKDFVIAVETLKRISGMDKRYPISLHELSACIYYKLAIDRGLRGCDPTAEARLHRGQHGSVELPELNRVIKFAPFALMIVYEESAPECDRLARLQGYSTIIINEKSQAEQPAYAIFAPLQQQSNAPRFSQEAILAIRGTHSIQDVVTDIRAIPEAFPPSDDEIMSYLGLKETDTTSRVVSRSNNDASEEWEWLDASNVSTYASGGIVRSAIYILQECGKSLLLLIESGFKIVVVGHSLGAAVGALVTSMLRKVSQHVHCIGFGSPSFVDAITADDMRDYVTNIILHDDVIGRVTPNSIRLLMKELMLFRNQVFRHLRQDWYDVIKRAAAVWTPRFRATYGRPASSTGRLTARQRSISSPPAIEMMSPQAVEDITDAAKTSEGASVRAVAGEPVDPASLEDDEVLIAEEVFAEQYIPGRILHIYSSNGCYYIEPVPKDFSELRRIIVQGNMFGDHSSSSIFEALQEVRSIFSAPCKPPKWQPYDSSSLCSCCHNKFTWHSTFQGEAQELRERYNCRSCGLLVCGPCSSHRHAILRIGLARPSRICDTCFYRGEYSSEQNPS